MTGGPKSYDRLRRHTPDCPREERVETLASQRVGQHFLLHNEFSFEDVRYPNLNNMPGKAFFFCSRAFVVARICCHWYVCRSLSSPFLDLAQSLTTRPGLLFEPFRQSIALSAKQAANTTIPLTPYFTSKGSARKAIQTKIATGFTNRIVAESGLSGVNWSISPDNIRNQMNRYKRKPKGKKGFSK